MAGVRRSGRIAREVPIVLMGTDSAGRVFSEETSTVVLSRHGAGILSRHAFAPEERLSLRFPESSQEAEIRLVGRIGEAPNGYVYGVEFLDASTNYWGCDFPPPDEYSITARGIALECSICLEGKTVQQNEVEADVFLTTGAVFRFCEECGQTTAWRKAKLNRPSLKRAAATDAAAEALATVQRRSGVVEEPRKAIGAIGAAVLDPPAPAEARVGSTSPAGAKRENRRKHVRTRVTFMGCVRHAACADDLVECENVSKGGVCFRSKQKYSEGTVIEVAAPYEPGTTAIFVRATIVRAEPMLDSTLFRYGAAYAAQVRNASAPAPHW